MKVGQSRKGQGQELESLRTGDKGRTISQGEGQKLEGSRTRDEGRTVYSGTSAKQGKITF